MSIARSSALFASGTILSRVTGLARDMAVASVFGASVYLDAFFVAQRVPNLLREMLAEGSLGSAFTKVFTQMAVGDEEGAARLLRETMRTMTLLAILLCSLGIVLAPWLVELMTLMADEATESAATLVANATGLARLLFPMLGIFMLGAVAMGALHQRGRFFLTASAPILFNVGYIIGALVLSSWLVDAVEAGTFAWIPTLIGEPGVTGLALGVLVGSAAQLGIQLVGLRDLFGKGKARRRSWRASPELRQVLLLMGPMVLAASAGQINQIVNTIFATSLEAGAVSWLSYAFRLLHLPIGVFGVALGVASLPAITRQITEANGQVTPEAARSAQNAVDLVLWLMAPCMVFFLAASEPVVALLFQSGKFTQAHAQETAWALFAYSWSLPAYGLTKVFTSFYFALDRTSFAMKASMIGIAVNFMANYLLVRQHGHVGLAYAFSTTLTVNAAILALGLREAARLGDGRAFLRSLWLLASTGVVAWAGQRAIIELAAQWSTGNVKLDSGIQVVGAAAVLGATFFAAAMIRLRAGPKALLAMVRARRRR